MQELEAHFIYSVDERAAKGAEKSLTPPFTSDPYDCFP